jgi:TolB-like protein
MPSRLFDELKRRNVWRAAARYAAAAWLLVQVATGVFPFLGVPDWVVRWVIVAVAIGFPFWIAFAWLYEWTPEGLRREREVAPEASVTHRTGRALDRWIIGILALAVVLLLTNTLVWRRGAGLADASEAEALTAPPHSIAVLPFESLSSDPEQEFFADGISEDLLDLLTRVPALRVAARTSSFSFKGKELKVQEIARQLHVANVLQGSVRRAGDRVRISAQLVHAADGYQVWSQTWNRKLDDVFAIQDEIAADVVKQLRVRLLGAAAPQARPTDPQAYALFLQARELGRHREREALLRSDSLYRQVLAVDPRYAPAWVELARNAANGTSLGILSAEASFTQGWAAAQRALSIDSSYAPAWGMLGALATLRGDLPGAARELQRALALDPTNPSVLGNCGILLRSLGRLQEVIAIDEYLVARDPVNPSSIYNLGSDYYGAGRYDEAIARYRTALSLTPARGIVHSQIGMALLLQGDAKGALAEFQQEPSEHWRLSSLPMAYHALGREAESDSALAEVIRKYAKEMPYNIAYVYAYRGEADRAFEWLEKAVEYNDPGLYEVPTQPLLASLRSDPRWLPFLHRIGMAPEQLARIPFRVRLPEVGESAAGAG